MIKSSELVFGLNMRIYTCIVETKVGRSNDREYKLYLGCLYYNSPEIM